jgi:hypothetical protein
VADGKWGVWAEKNGESGHWLKRVTDGRDIIRPAAFSARSQALEYAATRSRWLPWVFTVRRFDDPPKPRKAKKRKVTR